MNYQDLYYFIKVVESGNLTIASDKLDIPTSTLSRRLISLEESLGYQLLHRSSRKFGLTNAGNQFYERLRGQFNEIEFEYQNVMSELAGISGDLTVSAPLALGRHVVSKWLFEFMAMHPNISVQLLLSNKSIDLVSAGVDVALRVGEPGINDWVVRPVAPLKYTLLASPEFVAKHGQPAAVKDLETMPTVSMLTTPLWRLIGPTGQVTINPKSLFKSDVVTACLEAALAHVGIASLPHNVAESAINEGKLVRVLPDWHVHSKPVNVLYPKRDHIPAKNRELIDFITKKAQSL